MKAALLSYSHEQATVGKQSASPRQGTVSKTIPQALNHPLKTITMTQSGHHLTTELV